jgi:excinuclease ABC subunit C
MENVAEVDDPGVLAAFLQQYYDAAAIIPPEILLPCAVPDCGVLEEWLSQHRGKRVRIETPLRGDKRRLLDLAADNAREALEQEQVKWLTDSQKTAAALTELQEALELPTLPVRLECFDISTIQGTSTVASMVVFENGKPRTDAYRRFRIKTVDGTDDFAAMREVLTRRLKRSGLATNQATGDRRPAPCPEGTRAADAARSGATDCSLGSDLPPTAYRLPPTAGEDGTEWTRHPDLIIVDGGKGQLGAALEVLREMGIEDQPIAALAKQNEELFLPGRSHPVVLPRTSQALFLVQRLRDEAHRFAITYHRNVRGKRAIVSGLDEIRGVGSARKKALVKRFGSVSELRRASAEEIAAVPGIGAKLAASIKSQLGGA